MYWLCVQMPFKELMVKEFFSQGWFRALVQSLWLQYVQSIFTVVTGRWGRVFSVTGRVKQRKRGLTECPIVCCGVGLLWDSLRSVFAQSYYPMSYSVCQEDSVLIGVISLRQKARSMDESLFF